MEDIQENNIMADSLTTQVLIMADSLITQAIIQGTNNNHYNSMHN